MTRANRPPNLAGSFTPPPGPQPWPQPPWQNPLFGQNGLRNPVCKVGAAGGWLWWSTAGVWTLKLSSFGFFPRAFCSSPRAQEAQFENRGTSANSLLLQGRLQARRQTSQGGLIPIRFPSAARRWVLSNVLTKRACRRAPFIQRSTKVCVRHYLAGKFITILTIMKCALKRLFCRTLCWQQGRQGAQT